MCACDNYVVCVKLCQTILIIARAKTYEVGHIYARELRDNREYVCDI